MFFLLPNQVFSDGEIMVDRVGELEDAIYIRGLDDWPTIGEEEKVVCGNCFRAIHAISECEYLSTIVIPESPLKIAVIEEPVVECNASAAQAEDQKYNNELLPGELKDDDFNEAYDELLTQEINPDSKDFNNDHDEATGDQNLSKYFFFNNYCSRFVHI
jgi:hypothetical protein